MAFKAIDAPACAKQRQVRARVSDRDHVLQRIVVARHTSRSRSSACRARRSSDRPPRQASRRESRARRHRQHRRGSARRSVSATNRHASVASNSRHPASTSVASVSPRPLIHGPSLQHAVHVGYREAFEPRGLPIRDLLVRRVARVVVALKRPVRIAVPDGIGKDARRVSRKHQRPIEIEHHDAEAAGRTSPLEV